MRKQYDNAFKLTIIELKNSGRSTKELSEEYGVAQNLISRWCREYSARSGDMSKRRALSAEEQENRLLRRELREVQLERDILKKAVSIFSKSDR
jgi:transposase